MINEDTICAIATAQGGAIGIVRVSGPQAISITDRIFTPAGRPIPLVQREPYTITFGHIYNDAGENIDDVLVSLFRAPHSYTGEDCTEISCHGSPYILQQVMQLLITHGCRSAHPGEYTQRAFLNGKMDLSQAEAVADLIASTSATSHRLAMNQMRGGFSHELSHLRDQLLRLTSLIELELDFSDHEELEFANRTELQVLSAKIEQLISHLVQTFALGNAIKNGIPVAIIGETNAGKSTLLNALVGEDRAIVSDIHGTTRDVIEDTINIDGILFRFIDTAGIRETHDAIERLGIERTFQKIDQAEIVLWLMVPTDDSDRLYELASSILPRCAHKQLIIIYNKIDQADTCPSHFFHPSLPPHTLHLSLSAKYGIHLDELRQMLIETSHLPNVSSNDVIITNVRHFEALTNALKAIQQVQQGLTTGLSGDLISQDLRECLFYLGSIVGEVTTDEVLGNIFRNFCVGK